MTLSNFIINALTFLGEAVNPKYPLKAKYKEFNKKYFANELPTDIELKFNGRLKSAVGRCTSLYNKKTGEITPIRIELATFPADRYKDEYHEDFYDDTLVHEMVHAWVDINKGNVPAHGNEFKTKMKEVMGKGNFKFTSMSDPTATHIPDELLDKIYKPKKPGSKYGFDPELYIKMRKTGFLSSA